MFVLNYLAVPATEFDRLAVDDDQVDAVHELLESAEYPTTDIDKAWGPLSMVVGESPIMGAIAGTQEWDEEVTANPPALVAEQAASIYATLSTPGVHQISQGSRSISFGVASTTGTTRRWADAVERHRIDGQGIL